VTPSERFRQSIYKAWLRIGVACAVLSFVAGAISLLTDRSGYAFLCFLLVIVSCIALEQAGPNA
jgi:hypothetical protein